jgi:mono/diheme cytochrome c family protein
MTRSPRRLFLLGAVAVSGLVVSACGSQGIQLAKSDQNYKGAQIFANHCAGCHTLNVAGTQGSAYNVRTREYKDGPNFNQRKETVQDVLYAIRNGGFSSGPMPQDIVTGSSAERVARFVAKYSGNEAQRTVQPTQPPVQGAQGGGPTG